VPEVSVLLPVHNGEPYLAAAIESILAQTFRNFELLVVDDGSTDGSASRVRAYTDSRIRLISQDRQLGLSAALNCGLQAATAPLVARQDADDVSRPDRLERQVAHLRRHPDLVLLGSRARAIDEDGRVLGRVDRPLDAESIAWFAHFDNPFIHTAVVMRRDVALACGGFDAGWDPFSQDYALWFQMLAHGRAENLADQLVDYRVRGSSIIGLVEGAQAGDYRDRFAQTVRSLVSRHQLATFRDALDLSESDAALMSGFVLGVRAADLPRVLELFAREIAWFTARYLQANPAPDFRATLARQYEALAYRVDPHSRAAACRVYAAAVAAHPRLVGSLSWSRAAALSVLGKSGYVRASSWLRRRQARSPCPQC